MMKKMSGAPMPSGMSPRSDGQKVDKPFEGKARVMGMGKAHGHVTQRISIPKRKPVAR